jgi:hypothetical protein
MAANIQSVLYVTKPLIQKFFTQALKAKNMKKTKMEHIV